MTRRTLGWSLSALLTAGILAAPLQPAFADSNDTARPHNRHTWARYHLPAERHVVEGVLPPGSGVYLINGRVFTAQSSACQRWTAGDRIRLVRGDWNGYCNTAVFHNLSRRSSCALSCPGGRHDYDPILGWSRF